MTWFKVDDGLHSHRKVMSIPRRDRVAALGLWVIAGSWCADNLTDGHVPRYMLTEWAATDRLATTLCSARMWVEVEDGYQFHEWNQPGRQPTRAEVEANREYERKRKADQREQRRLSQRDNTGTPGGTPGGTPAGVPVGVRTPRPDPTRPVLSNGLSSQSPHPSNARQSDDGLDVDRIAKALKSSHRHALAVIDQVLAKAPRPPANPTSYILGAIGREPHLYRETTGPPPLGALCDQHGRDRATCPPTWHKDTP